MWDTWNKGKNLTLKKNPHYWRKDDSGQQLPYLDSVTWTVVPDDNTRGLQIKGGQAQINENPPYSSLDQFKGDPTAAVVLFPSTRTDYILMNEKRDFFADVNVRRAVSYAIDREGLIKTVLYGNGTPANSLFMPTVPVLRQGHPGPDLRHGQGQVGAGGVEVRQRIHLHLLGQLRRLDGRGHRAGAAGGAARNSASP